MDFIRGLGFGIVLALPLWAVIIVIAVGLAGCGRHDDGMGDLWKGVKYVQEHR